MKYPLSYAAKSPIASILLFGILFLPVPGDAASMDAVLSTGDWIWQLTFSFLETLLFARIFLKELLAERNEVLARNILEQCRLQQKQEPPGWKSLWTNIAGNRRQRDLKNSVVYAPLSTAPVFEHEEKTVVAVLGMAHCNGIMKLLQEQRVS